MAAAITVTGTNGRDVIAIGYPNYDRDQSMHIFGLAGKDRIVGGREIDTIEGGDGDDTLHITPDSGDILYGGAGDDWYPLVGGTLGSTELVELAGEGHDTLEVMFSNRNHGYHFYVDLVLPDNVEDFYTERVDGGRVIGNDAHNRMDIASGPNNPGRCTLDGGAGDDTLRTHSGNSSLMGGEGNDVLLGSYPRSDTLEGGLGDDLIYWDAGDTIVELAGEGVDTVMTWEVSTTLGDNFENLFLQGSALDGLGNSLDNRIMGSEAANILNGMAGADTLSGGLEDDIYLVNDGGDVAFEAQDEGEDLVRSSIDFRLGANIENLSLTGEADRAGRGNKLDNVLRGNAGANILAGEAGADSLIGGRGNDVLNGGGGADRFEFGPQFGEDKLKGFVQGDVIAFDDRLFSDFDDVMAQAAQHGRNVVIDAGAHGGLTLVKVDLADLDASDFDFFAA